MERDDFKMRTRRACHDDASAVADVWLRSRDASLPSIPAPTRSDDEVRRWLADFVVPTRDAWVVSDDSMVVAMLVLDKKWVDQLYVDPSHTGKGLGSELLDVAKRERPGGLTLWTFTTNEGAQRFCERHGFVAVETTEGDNEEGSPAIRYDWPAT